MGVAVRWVRERERQDTVNQLVTMVNSALTDSAHFSSGHMLGLQDISSVQYVIFSHFKRLQVKISLTLFGSISIKLDSLS